MLVSFMDIIVLCAEMRTQDVLGAFGGVGGGEAAKWGVLVRGGVHRGMGFGGGGQLGWSERPEGW